MKNTCGEIQFYCNWFHQFASFSKVIHTYFSMILKKYLFLKYLQRTVSNSVIDSHQVYIARLHIQKSIHGDSCFANLRRFLKKVKSKIAKKCWKLNNRHTFSHILRTLLSTAALFPWSLLWFCKNRTNTTFKITDRNNKQVTAKSWEKSINLKKRKRST